MFCVDCGKEKEIFRKGSCIDCYLKHHEFTKGPTFIDIPYCVHCDSYKYKNLWYHEPFDAILIRYVKHFFSINNELKQVSFSVRCDDEVIQTCSVNITGSINDHKITESHTITIRLKNTVCDVCSKQFGGYHEAILQIRPGNKKLSKDKLEEIEQFIEEQLLLLQQKNNSLFLSDVRKEHGGIDYFLSDKQAAYTLLKKTHEHFGGHITTSSKNVGMKDGKQLYRDTYLLRLLPFNAGDVLKIDEEYVYVEQLNKNTIHLYELDTNKRSIRDASELEKAIVIGGRDLIQPMIFISQKNNEIQVMDPTTYKISTLKKSLEQNITTDTVSVIFINEEHMYIHPIVNEK